MSINENLRDSWLRRQLSLFRFDGSIRNKVRGYMASLSQSLGGILGASDDLQTKKGQREVELQAKNVISEAYDGMAKTSAEDIGALAIAETGWAVNAINREIDIGGLVLSGGLTAKQAANLVNSSLIEGSPMSAWWVKQSVELQDKFVREIRQGVSFGETLNQLVQRVRGKATGKRNVYWSPVTGKRRTYVEFAGGIMDTGTRQAEALVRTAVQEVAGQARAAMYQQNSDIIRGVQQQSTLDTKTSNICLSYHGATWDLEGNPIPPKKRPWKGWGPLHYNCRRTLVPLVKSWEELGLDLPELPAGTQASFTGQVPAELSIDEWVDSLSAADREDLLGPGRAELWKEGKITTSDLVAQNGRSLTISELEEAA